MPTIGTFPTDNLYQLDPALPPKESLPTMDDLPCDFPDELGLPHVFHFLQAILLYETFQTPLLPWDWVFKAGNLDIFFDPRHPLRHERPIWFAVLGVPAVAGTWRNGMRRSFVVWQEGRVPSIIVELPWPEAEDAALDRTDSGSEGDPPTKWQVYEQILAVPTYVTFHPEDKRLHVFQLDNGRYRDVEIGAAPVWLEGLGLALGTWTGTYMQLRGTWLRWFDREGRMIPTGKEQAEAESQRAEAAERQLRALLAERRGGGDSGNG